MPDTKRRPNFSVRLLAEGLVVVTSILLAFAIDAWWEGHTDRSAEQRILQELAGELRQNQAKLDDMLAFHADTEDAARTALELAASDVAVEPDSIDQLIGALSWPSGSEWITGSLDAVLFSGDLALIENKELRARIAAWPTSIARVVFWEDQEFKSHHEKWIPFLT